MEIKSVEIKNYRALKNIHISMTKLMLLVGKNNSGKTTFFEIFDVFFGNKKFAIADFTKGLISKLVINKIYEDYISMGEHTDDKIKVLENRFPVIELIMTLDLSDKDYSKIRSLIYEFSDNDCLILVSRFVFHDLVKLIKSFEEYNKKIVANKKSEIEFFTYFLDEYENYYVIEHYTTKPSKTEKSKLIDHTKIREMFSINIIKARRDVDDTSDQAKQAISTSLWKHFQYTRKNDVRFKDLFADQTNQIKLALEDKYSDIFDDVIKNIHDDLLVGSDSNIKILSSIDIENMLKSNSKMRYIMDDLELSEAYNGLGFSNLIYMFIEIYHFNYVTSIDDKAFNILFIEEPESHLHPQMQLTFYKKLEKVLSDNKNSSIIFSTHSSHLLSISDFNVINYFYRDNYDISVKSLELFISENKDFEKFLRKYFKINAADLFFADKAVLYEGAAERLLFPIFLEKFDSKHKSNLSNQHISLFEVGGRYANVFYKLLEYLNLKSLIIADNDSVAGKTKVTCNLYNEMKEDSSVLKTSNGVIKSWFDMLGKDLYIKDLVNDTKDKFQKTTSSGTKLYLALQLPQKPLYHCGRTLEEELIIHNARSISEDINHKIKNPKHVLRFEMIFDILNPIGNVSVQDVIDKAYEIVENLDKTGFALELIENFDSWDIPIYIEEGLKWLEN